jgi:hypothetical protein
MREQNAITKLISWNGICLKLVVPQLARILRNVHVHSLCKDVGAYNNTTFGN